VGPLQVGFVVSVQLRVARRRGGRRTKGACLSLSERVIHQAAIGGIFVKGKGAEVRLLAAGVVRIPAFWARGSGELFCRRLPEIVMPASCERWNQAACC